MYTGFSKFPYSCNYWVTYRCNSQCTFCRIWNDTNLKKTPDLSFKTAKSNLNDLKKMGVTFIDFTGGEPLLNRELPQILTYAKQLGFFVKLSTNGYLYPDIAHKIKGNVSRLYFSFDTTSEEEYKIIRGIDGYKRLLESIHLAQNLGEDICLTCTITNETVKNIKPFATFCKEHKVIGYIHPSFSYFNNEKLNTAYIREIKKYFWHPYIRMNLPDLDFYYHGGNNINHPSCLVGKSTFDISPDDCILLPCFHHCRKKIKIAGNLLSLFYSDDWVTWFQNNGSYDFCRNCSIDCYFGYSYWDKIQRGFLKENLTMFKNIIESIRIK